MFYEIKIFCKRIGRIPTKNKSFPTNWQMFIKCLMSETYEFDIMKNIAMQTMPPKPL